MCSGSSRTGSSWQDLGDLPQVNHLHGFAGLFVASPPPPHGFRGRNGIDAGRFSGEAACVINVADSIQWLPQDQRKTASNSVETATVRGFKAVHLLVAVIAGLAAIASWILFKPEGIARRGR